MAQNNVIDDTINMFEYVLDYLDDRETILERSKPVGAPNPPELLEVRDMLSDIEDIIRKLEKLDDKIEFWSDEDGNLV